MRRSDLMTIVLRGATCGLVILFLLGLALCSFGQGNPFDEAGHSAYAGRFRGTNIDLRLNPDGPKWKGVLIFKEKTYNADGDLKAGRLEGHFSDGEHAWPFTAVVEEDQLTFTTENVSTVLLRQKLPRLAGAWGSKKGEIDFQTTGNQQAGSITFAY